MQPLSLTLPWRVEDRCFRQTQSRPYLVTHVAIFVGLLASAMLDIDAESVIPAATLIFALLAYWTLFSWYKVHGTLFDPYPLFLISSWLFNGAHFLLEILSLNKNGILDGVFSSETIVQTGYMVALAIAAMHLGALWASTGIAKSNGAATMGGHHASSNWNTRMIGWLLLVFSIGPAVLSFREAGEMVLAGGYFALYQRTFDTGFATAPRLIANFLIPSALLILAGSKSRKSGIFLSAGIILLYAGGMFFIGCRAAASMALVAYVWLYSRTIRGIPVKALIVPVLIVVFVIYPIIGAIRNTSGAERTSIEGMWNAWAAIENPAVSSLSEIGRSMSAVSHTIELVPVVRPFDIGASYLYAVLAVLPNVGWDVHPTMAHGTLANWLVRTVEPRTAARGGGLGYSFIAEAYANFGWAGVPAVLLAIGWGAGRLSTAISNNRDPAALAMAATVLSFALIYARSETADFIRNVCWYGVGPYLLVRFVNAVRR